MHTGPDAVSYQWLTSSYRIQTVANLFCRRRRSSAKPAGSPYYDGLKFHWVISIANGDGW